MREQLKTCQTCRYFYKPALLCKRHAPTPPTNTFQTYEGFMSVGGGWPKVKEDWWCGDYKTN